jgi:UDP:flavonoid glycosyltransferase YjiC (YdhE family)
VEIGPPDLHTVFAGIPERAGLTGAALAEVIWSKAFATVLAEAMASGARAFFDAWTPDLLVHEDSELGTWVAAERLGVPHVALEATAWRTRMQVLMREPLGRLRLAQGLPPDPGLQSIYRHGFLATRPPALRDARQPMPVSTRPIRPVAVDDTAGASAPVPVTTPGRRRVVVTLGTMAAATADAFDAVLEGLARVEAEVVMTVGPAVDPAVLGVPPANVTIERYIPMSRLLPTCDVLVFHGGSGTMLAAVAAGVPLVVLPTAADQPTNADRCRAAGIAVVVERGERTPRAIREAVEEVLGDDRYRSAAAAVRREVEAMPAPDVVLRDLERLVVGGAGRRRPTPGRTSPAA